ncbi:MAG: DNA-binding protein [Thermoprotei archaeon]|nr:DNA-directed RNA polymerase, subunit E'' [Thermoproteales archaeon]RLE91325.1 MAG: DNA-binding protein [Thermoprotei archaeon]HDJ96844.1 DNA-directed RNA polymerase, subunit E'' [Thermofilum sp.]
MPRKRGLPLKACIKCKMLVEPRIEVCPNCGSRVFSNEWTGLVIIMDVEKSLVAKKLNIKTPGMYALKVH